MNAPIKLTVERKAIVGTNCGNVIRQKISRSVAPNIFAILKCSGSILRNPAKRIMILNAKLVQTPKIISVGILMFTLSNQFTAGIPIKPRKKLIIP